MNNYANSYYFPVSSGVFPYIEHSLLSNVVGEVASITQAHDSMICLAALCAMSTSVQGLIDVQLPVGKKAPVSLMGLTKAESGERKSTVENLVMKGLHGFQKDRLEEYEVALQKYNFSCELRAGTKAGLKRVIARKESRGESADEEIQRFIEYVKEDPDSPKKPKIIYEDSTPEALLYGLHKNSPVGYLGSSEGGVLLAGRSVSQTPKINSIWSGDDVSVDRISAESFVLTGARLTVNIMTQSNALSEYFSKRNSNSRGSGFLARFLVCEPPSSIGYRNVTEYAGVQEAIDSFADKNKEFLGDSLACQNSCNRKVLKLSVEAKSIWIDIANNIEGSMASGGRYENAKDHASKLSENIARISAILNFYENSDDDEISAKNLWLSINLCSYYSAEFLRIFNAPPQYVINANLLSDWLGHKKINGVRYIKKNNIRQLGPKPLRNKKALDEAISYLYDSGFLQVILVGRTTVVDLFYHLQHDQDQLDSALACG